MKKILIFAFCVALALSVIWAVLPIVHATEFPVATANDTITLALLGPTTSNKTGTAYFVEAASLHTFQIITYCTNAVSNVISGSLDSTNWVPLATNSASSSSTNGITLSNQRWSYLRAVFTLTTANGSTNTVTYLGSRQ